MTEFDYTDKIQKLLLKAESATPEEAELLTDKVTELMLKYSITQAQLDAKKQRSGGVAEEIITRSLNINLRAYHKYFIRIWHYAVLGMDNGVKCYRTQDRRTKEHLFVMVGFKSDIEQMEVLLRSLELQAVVAMRSFMKSHPDREFLGSREKQLERNEFYIGFANGVSKRFRIVRETAARNDRTGTDLVLARGAKVDQYMRQNISLTPGRQSRRTQSGSYYANGQGFVAGRNANTGGQSVGGSRKEIR